MARPRVIFIAYSRKDADLRAQLDAHLSLLKRDGLVVTWHDGHVVPGDDWDGAIQHQLQIAEMILLLITSDFIASDLCIDVELQSALTRHSLGEVRVVPVIARPCDWRSTRFAQLQAVPTDAKPVTTWENPDEAWVDVVQGVRVALDVPNTEAMDRPSGAAHTPGHTLFLYAGLAVCGIFGGGIGLSTASALGLADDAALERRLVSVSIAYTIFAGVAWLADTIRQAAVMARPQSRLKLPYADAAVPVAISFIAGVDNISWSLWPNGGLMRWTTLLLGALSIGVIVRLARRVIRRPIEHSTGRNQ